MSEWIVPYVVMTAIISLVGTVIWWVARGDNFYLFGSGTQARDVPLSVYVATNVGLVAATLLFPVVLAVGLFYGLIHLPRTVAYWRTFDA